MRLKMATVLLALSALAPPVLSQGRFDDWRSGDLIFHESRGAQAAAIRVATGSPYTHMGIVEVAEDGVFVVEAARTVGATPLREFIARGASGEYAVYRLPGLAPEEATAVLSAARNHFGQPYDIFFRLAPDAIYCSELPYYAFRSIGRDLGAVQRLGALAVSRPEAREIFLSRWRDHPDCAGIDQQACWNVIQSQEIVTPVSIAGDAALEQVFSNMKP
ncbi:MAG: YiiX/YebB-like N1pC/P60 family cysteine hydrolase [Pikeienuella sp.]